MSNEKVTKCEDCKDGYVMLLLTKHKCDTCDGKGFISVVDASCEDMDYLPPPDTSGDQMEMPWWNYVDGNADNGDSSN